MKKIIFTHSPEETMRLSEQIGSNLKGGECIELISDVGGGKTTFVRGLARGAGSNDHVSSPTFTISKVYKTPLFEIVHFDFYRLQEAGLIEHEIKEAVHEPKSVIVVEWSDIIKHVLPKDRVQVKIGIVNEEGRELNFDYSPSLSYLFKDIA